MSEVGYKQRHLVPGWETFRLPAVVPIIPEGKLAGSDGSWSLAIVTPSHLATGLLPTYKFTRGI